MHTSSKEYQVTIIVDKQWLDILNQISKHQEGFVWVNIEEQEWEEVNV